MCSFFAGAESGPPRTIKNSAFWPDIDLADFSEQCGIDGTVIQPRVYNAVVESITSCNRDLKAWRQQQQADGYHSLDQLPSEDVDGQHEFVFKYARAVYCYAAASLRERYRDYDTTVEGHKRADLLEPSIDDLRRDGRWAISDLLGESRSTIELL